MNVGNRLEGGQRTPILRKGPGCIPVTRTSLSDPREERALYETSSDWLYFEHSKIIRTNGYHETIGTILTSGQTSPGNRKLLQSLATSVVTFFGCKHTLKFHLSRFQSHKSWIFHWSFSQNNCLQEYVHGKFLKLRQDCPICQFLVLVGLCFRLERTKNLPRDLVPGQSTIDASSSVGS